MIAYLEGTIRDYTKTGIILLVGQVGYEILGTRLQEHKLGTTLELYTHHAVDSNNNQSLIGFVSLDARDLFRQLLKVPGIGPKTALAITESAPQEALRQAIMTSDLSFFTNVKGVGKKAAQKIILELKNQLVDDPISTRTHAPIYEALTSLRFSNQEIRDAIKSHDLTGLTESESIKLVLQSLGR